MEKLSIEGLGIGEYQELSFGNVEQEITVRHLSRDAKSQVNIWVHETGIWGKDPDRIQIQEFGNY